MCNKYLFGLLFLLSFMIFYSCESETILVESVDLELDFYPMNSQKIWQYQVDSIIYDDEGLTVYNTSSFMQERLTGPFLNSEQDTFYIIEVSKKQNEDEDYFPSDQWIMELRDNKLIRIEENLTFVKLIFPPNFETVWDGNQFPDDTEIFVSGDAIEAYKNWDYRVLDRLDSKEVLDETYTEVLMVQQADDENLIEKRYSVEYYSKGIGLIEKEMYILDTQCTDPSCEALSWEEKAEQGFILRQKLIDHF